MENNNITENSESIEDIKSIKAVTEIIEVKKSKSTKTNKRIDFNQKTMTKLNIMLPLYNDEAGEGIKESELYSYVVNLAINKLFEGDFKEKLENI